MREIESELHQMLLDLAPHCTEEEQAIVVAEAAAIFAQRTRLAGRNNTAQRENCVIDAVLTALSYKQDWDDQVPYIDGRGMSASQIVRSAGKMNRDAPDLGVEILNDSDMDVFFFEPGKNNDPNSYDIEDGVTDDWDEDVHPSSLYDRPGMGRHRSDSQSR